MGLLSALAFVDRVLGVTWPNRIDFFDARVESNAIVGIVELGRRHFTGFGGSFIMGRHRLGTRRIRRLFREFIKELAATRTQSKEIASRKQGAEGYLVLAEDHSTATGVQKDFLGGLTSHFQGERAVLGGLYRIVGVFGRGWFAEGEGESVGHFHRREVRVVQPDGQFSVRVMADPPRQVLRTLFLQG